MKVALFAGLLVSLGLLASGCVTTPCALEGSCAVGHGCTGHSDCADGACVDDGPASDATDSGVCGVRCETDPCDEGRVCATIRGVSACVLPCSGEDVRWPFVGSEHDHAFCDLGVPYDCAELDEHPTASCQSCVWSEFTYQSNPCADGQFCDTTGTGPCEPLRGLLGACETGDDCGSLNCSMSIDALPLAHKCLVAHGEACTTDDCTSCATTSGTTFCHQECRTPSDCPSSHPLCFGSAETNMYWCRAACPASGCPSGYHCAGTSDPSVTICLPY